MLSAGQVSMDGPEPSDTHSLHQNTSKPYSPASFETECRALVIVTALVGSIQRLFAGGGPRVNEGIWNGSGGTFASMMSVSTHLSLEQTLRAIDDEGLQSITVAQSPPGSARMQSMPPSSYRSLSSGSPPLCPLRTVSSCFPRPVLIASKCYLRLEVIWTPRRPSKRN